MAAPGSEISISGSRLFLWGKSATSSRQLGFAVSLENRDSQADVLARVRVFIY